MESEGEQGPRVVCSPARDVRRPHEWNPGGPAAPRAARGPVASASPGS